MWCAATSRDVPLNSRRSRATFERSRSASREARAHAARDGRVPDGAACPGLSPSDVLDGIDADSAQVEPCRGCAGLPPTAAWPASPPRNSRPLWRAGVRDLGGRADCVGRVSVRRLHVGACPSMTTGSRPLDSTREPDLDRVLGATSFVVDTLTGEIVESDVFFNSIFTWSTAAAGDAGRFDLQSVATHEIGHFVGLGHSAIGRDRDPARRWTTRARVWRRDVSHLAWAAASRPIARCSPMTSPASPTSIPMAISTTPPVRISGRVVRNGTGVHRRACHRLQPEDRCDHRRLRDRRGRRVSDRRPDAGAHVIRVEPLDDADIDSFFSPSGIDVDFQVTLFPRLVVAPAGGASDRFDVSVRPK